MPVTRCIVYDKNLLSDESLGHWLSECSGNIIVLTEFCMMESYSGDGVKNFMSSMSIVKYFANQVVLMKRNDDLKLVNGSKINLSDVIDWDSTTQIRVLLQTLRDGKDVDLDIILKNKRVAEATLDMISSRTSKNKYVLDQVMSQIRKYRLGTDENGVPVISPKGLSGILDMAVTLGKSTNKKEGPVMDENCFINSFAFRYALACTCHGVIRAVQGTFSDLSNKTMRNDVIDCNYIASSTYCDGLETRDSNAKKIYNLVNKIINRVK